MEIFGHVLCGFDGSPEGEEALRQAMRLVAPDGRLVVATVSHTGLAYRTGWDASRVLDELRQDAEQTRLRAQDMIASMSDADAIVVDGAPDSTMLWLARKRQPTLVVVGTHGHGRATRVMLGSVARAVVHSAPCSVLITRSSSDHQPFPRSILLGADGSPQSIEAAQVALALHRRFDVPLRTLVAQGGKGIDRDALRRLGVRDFGEFEWDDRSPVDALNAASLESDLTVIGSRGLHGFRALGSVSERVAHGAACSVLVVRPSAGR
jgi:nucleotide-binding universal stress UspA family protein